MISEGWNCSGPAPSQRRAPLTVTPMPGTFTAQRGSTNANDQQRRRERAGRRRGRGARGRASPTRPSAAVDQVLDEVRRCRRPGPAAACAPTTRCRPSPRPNASRQSVAVSRRLYSSGTARWALARAAARIGPEFGCGRGAGPARCAGAGRRALRTVSRRAHRAAFDHFVLTVADPEATVAFYERLGMRREEFDDGRLALRFGEQKINLHRAGQADPAPRAAARRPGSADVCLLVDGHARRGRARARARRRRVRARPGAADRRDGRRSARSTCATRTATWSSCPSRI